MPKNYRPISLTSVICRTMERIIHQRMLTHLLSNNILSTAQHGFIQQRSTQTQQIQFLNHLTSCFDKNEQLEIIYLDFSKAFDKVSHSKLINVLTYYKINSKVIHWVQSYLSKRTQVTVVDNVFSDFANVASGVPQGSVLGPLMFIVYLQDLINCISNKCTNTTIYAFADDLKLVSSDPVDLQKALDIVNIWTKQWDLMLNAEKSEHLTIRNKVTNSFFIDNQMVPKVRQVRDLGVILTDDIKWITYINKSRSKSNMLSHLIIRTFSPKNTKLLVNLYKTYVRPIMEYNTCTWSTQIQSDIKEIESVQRTFTRRICQRANISYSSYNDRLKKLDLESLESRRIKNDLIFLYKIINNLVDVNFEEYFQFHSFGGHNLRTHSLHILRKSPPKTLCRQNFFSYRVVPFWNVLPETTARSPTLAIFKRKLKTLQFSY